MCMYNLALNDELVRDTRQSFANDKEMTIWLQSQVEALLIEYNSTQQAIKRKARKAIEMMRTISENNGNSEMTLDDINREIQLAREARKVQER